LCRLLEATGVLGVPREVFSRPEARRRLGRDPHGGLEAMLAEASTANDIYAFKLFAYHVDIMASAKWIGRLPGLKFVHLTRGDLLGQAISEVRSLQTRAFNSQNEAQGEPRYDARAIARSIARLALNEARWRAYFARNAIEPLARSYEALNSDPVRVVETIAEMMGVDAVCGRPDTVTISVQRDTLSEEWRERFLGEARDPDRLDGGRLAPVHAWLRRMRAKLGL
jgi:LPS sulfotransferase NodH